MKFTAGGSVRSCVKLRTAAKFNMLVDREAHGIGAASLEAQRRRRLTASVASKSDKGSIILLRYRWSASGISTFPSFVRRKRMTL